MVVIDKIRKYTHFIHVKSTYKDINIAEIFMNFFLDCMLFLKW